MNYLSATGLAKSYGTKVLFEDLTFGVGKGQKIALVGRNGCGKSTLLRIFAGKDQPDAGEVSLRNGLRTAFLDQEPDFGAATTVMDALFSGDDPKLSVVRRFRQLSTDPQADPQALQDAMDAMEVHKAWDYESRVRVVLGKLGIADTDQAVAELSGGQRKRVALARVIVQEPDFLVLDEPTNHLDTDTIEWLENYFAASTVTLVLVTHDRYFLDRVCNEIVELDGGAAFRYEGDYEHFLTKKAEREAAQDMDTARAQNLLRKELEWLRRQPKARTTKSKARIDAAEGLKDRAAGTRRESDIQLNFKAQRLGKKILELEHIQKAYQDLVLIRDFSYVFKKGERIGIVGPNGVGKSTFLNLITGKMPPDAGDIETGQTVAFGFYEQSGLNFKPGQLVIDVITEAAEEIRMGTGEKLSASVALGLFGFPPPVQYNHVSELSGGEKRRLYLLRVLMEQPNFLILDEPTNDLDLITLNTLEQFLLAYGGCLMIVSHDRYFLDKLCDHLFIFEGKGEIKPFPGTFREYRARKAAEAEKARQTARAKAATSAPKPKKKDNPKLSYKERKEYEALEGELETLEEKKAALIAQINAGNSDYQNLQNWGQELEAINQQINDKEDRWLELAERAE
ncbi:MAG: ABC-F family ATP-binding cassette domain-containing protein [Bacteroidota bacterium]